mmetsp:Transcript_12351/g.17728  ORF Transcript_12351/g.17728 Transcript_12351/m.17728 type:complete len:82 (+) Transcript_12351:884-1129(+)
MRKKMLLKTLTNDESQRMTEKRLYQSAAASSAAASSATATGAAAANADERPVAPASTDDNARAAGIKRRKIAANYYNGHGR